MTVYNEIQLAADDIRNNYLIHMTDDAIIRLKETIVKRWGNSGGRQSLFLKAVIKEIEERLK